MPVDIAYLRKHYESLSDEALMDIDRADLTEVAQQCYDDELKDRELSAPVVSEEEQEEDGGELHAIRDPEPDWAEEAACIFTFRSSPGRNTAPDAAEARSVLENAGIACYLKSEEIQEDDASAKSYDIGVMVPGNLYLPAQSVLDKEIFNVEVEAAWRTYFETLSDEEVHEADPNELFCGLTDRLKRLNKVCAEEKSRRGV